MHYGTKHELGAVCAIAQRDFLKFLRDKTRILISLLFPFIFVGILGKSLESNLGQVSGFNFLTFAFTGVLAQILFQSTAIGIISLNEDREKDLSQEIFVAPISRLSIIFGKIFGETLISLTQGAMIIIFALIMGVRFSPGYLLLLAPVALIICFFGGAFGIFVLAHIKTSRAANQIFPFVMFPQYFLAGVFVPIKILPPYLLILSRLAPMTWAVDFLRSVFYFGGPEYKKVVLFNPLFDILVIAAYLVFFLSVGTYFFVRNERNK